MVVGSVEESSAIAILHLLPVKNLVAIATHNLHLSMAKTELVGEVEKLLHIIDILVAEYFYDSMT